MSEIIEVDELLKDAEQDAIVSTFIIDGLMAHCEDEDALQRFLVAMVVNLSINRVMCPFCFTEKLADVVNEGFDKVTTPEGHDVVFKHAKEVAAAIKGGEVSH